MSAFFGLDCGAAMLKLAQTAGPGAAPQLVFLDPPSPFLAAAVAFDRRQAATSVGGEAWRRRLLAGAPVAAEFRDRLVEADSSCVAGGMALPALAVWGSWLHAAAQRMAALGGAARVGIAVPDDWQAPRWALPLAAARVGLQELVFVREGLAALAPAAQPEGEEVLLLSLGYGPARASLAVKQQGAWRLTVRRRAEEVSGAAVRRRIVNALAEEFIRATRRSPREDPAADQALHDALDAAIVRLCETPSTSVVADLGGRRFERPLGRSDLAAFAAPLRPRLEQLLRGVLEAAPLRLAAAPLVVWGELALLLPLEEWLASFSLRQAAPRLLPLDAVAAGAARIASQTRQESHAWTADLLAALTPQDGRLYPRLADVGSAPAWRLVEGLPLTAPEVIAPGRAVLEALEPDGAAGPARPLSGRSLRVGRDPERCEWVLDGDRWPTVSGQHVEIAREGAEWVVRDLGSSNGSYVNEALLRAPRALASGDVIGLGRQGPRLRFRLE